jgi:hypothetical protein
LCLLQIFFNIIHRQSRITTNYDCISVKWFRREIYFKIVISIKTEMNNDRVSVINLEFVNFFADYVLNGTLYLWHERM